jgi:hypothetical protein
MKYRFKYIGTIFFIRNLSDIWGENLVLSIKIWRSFIYEFSTYKQSNEGRRSSVERSNFTGGVTESHLRCKSVWASHSVQKLRTVDRLTPVPLLRIFQLVAHLYSLYACGVDDYRPGLSLPTLPSFGVQFYENLRCLVEKTHGNEWIKSCTCCRMGARGSVVGWGTMLQAGRSRVRVPMRWIFFFQFT